MLTRVSRLLLGRNPSKLLLGMLKDGALLSVVKIFSIVAGVLFSYLVARIYGAETTGLLAITVSFITIPTMIALFGANTSVHQLIPRHQVEFSNLSAYKVRNKLFLILLGSSILASIAAYLSAEWLASNIYKKVLLIDMFKIASPFIIVMVLGTFSAQSIRALNNIYCFAMCLLIQPLFKIVMLLVLTAIGITTINPLLSVNISALMLFLIAASASHYLFKKNVARDSRCTVFIESISSLIKLSTPMFMVSIMQLIIAETDTIMLGIMVDSKDVGVYSIAFKIAAFTGFFLVIVNTMVAPKYSQYFHQGEFNSLKELAVSTSRLMVILTLPIVAIFIFSGHFILGFFGSEFIGGYVALVLIVIGQLVTVMSGSVGFFLNMTGHQVNFNKIVSAGAFLNIILNYFLIPLIGIEGAALASLISMAFWNICAGIYVKNKFGFFVGYIPIYSELEKRNG